MLQTCINQNVFLYAMIAAGIVGVWCLFWSNRFYSRAVRDLGRMDRPKGKWTINVQKICKQRTDPLQNTGAFIRTQMARGKVLGMPVMALRQGSQNAAFITLTLLAGSLAIMYYFEYEWYLWIQYSIFAGVIACGLLLARVALDYSGKEDIILDGWTDYLENHTSYAASVQKETEQAAGRAKKAAVLAKKEAETPKQEESGKNGDTARVFQTPPDLRMEERITQVREGIRETAAADNRFSGMLSPEEEKIMREVIREYLI